MEGRESTFRNLDLGAPEIIVSREWGTGIGPAGRTEDTLGGVWSIQREYAEQVRSSGYADR